MKKLLVVSLLFISQICLLTPIYAIDQGNTKVVGMDRRSDVYFGSSVAIFGDYAIVGSPDESFIISDYNAKFLAGAAYLYKYSQATNSWNLVQLISPEINDANFGTSVAIDANKIVIGAFDQDMNGDDSGSNHGAVYIYENYTEGISTPIIISTVLENTYFGQSVAISNDRIIVGSPWGHTDTGAAGGNYGAAYVYFKEAGSWTLKQQIISPELDTWFGKSVSISGDYLAIGSQANGSIQGAGYAYHYNGSTWEEDSSFALDGREGVNAPNKVLVSKSFLFITAYLDTQASFRVGSVSIYKRNAGDTSWVFSQKIEPSNVPANGDFGVDISISSDEKTLAIGAGGAKKVLLYSQTPTGWSQTNTLVSFGKGSAFIFGESVAVTNSALLVGDPGHDYDLNGENYLSGAGAAYFFGSAKSFSPALIYYLIQ